MRITGFVPSKLNSQRLPRKNVALLGGKPLINYVLETLDAVETIDETVIYASDDEVMQHVQSGLNARLVARPAALDRDSASVQDFVNGFLDQCPCDVVVLLHATSPFISVETVATCVEEVRSGRHESAFAALPMQRFAWFEGRPLNYDLERDVPRTQDLEPVIVEQSGFYVFTADLFRRTQRRIDANAYRHDVDAIEGHDIDDRTEFEMAECLLELRRRI